MNDIKIGDLVVTRYEEPYPEFCTRVGIVFASYEEVNGLISVKFSAGDPLLFYKSEIVVIKRDGAWVNRFYPQLRHLRKLRSE